MEVDVFESIYSVVHENISFDLDKYIGGNFFDKLQSFVNNTPNLSYYNAKELILSEFKETEIQKTLPFILDKLVIYIDTHLYLYKNDDDLFRQYLVDFTYDYINDLV
jgi:hypothetical protein